MFSVRVLETPRRFFHNPYEVIPVRTPVAQQEPPPSLRIPLMAQIERMDSGYAWVVFVSDFCCFFVIGGTFYTNGFLILSMIKDYQWDLTSTALVGSLFNAASSITGPLSGLLVDKTSSRFVMMFGGLLLVIGNISSFFAANVNIMAFTFTLRGLGIGFVFVPMSSITSYYFKRYLNIVSGISASGAGFGILICSLIIEYSLQTYSLRGTFFVMAGIAAHLCLFGALCRPNEIEKKKKEKCITGNKGGSYFQFLKNVPLLILCISFFCWSVGVSIVLIFLPMYCSHHGSTSQETAIVFSLIGGANIVTRIFTGVAANADNINELTLYVGSFGVAGIATLLLPFYGKTLAGQIAFGIIECLFTEGSYACFNAINLKLVGVSHVALATGLEMFFSGSGFFVGPPVAAMIKKHTGSLDMVFVFAGLTFLVSSFSGMFMTFFPSPTSNDLQNGDILKDEDLRLTLEVLPVSDKIENTESEEKKEFSPMLA